MSIHQKELCFTWKRIFDGWRMFYKIREIDGLWRLKVRMSHVFFNVFYSHKHDPKGGPGEPLCKADLKPAKDMKKMVKDYRMNQCKAKR